MGFASFHARAPAFPLGDAKLGAWTKNFPTIRSWEPECIDVKVEDVTIGYLAGRKRDDLKAGRWQNDDAYRTEWSWAV